MMSTKRTSTESSCDEQTSECSDLFQQDDNAKRAKLASLSDTTLQDLPIEILEHILIEVVTAEVKDAKLVRNVWKEKTDLVIDRLITVSPLWSSIITTDIFRNKVNRILDDTAQEPIRLEIMKQSSLEIFALDVTTLKDEMFVLWQNDYYEFSINVYDLNNLDQVKDVIPLPGRNPLDLTGCSVSNCVYLLDKKKWFEVITVLRITKDDNNQFNVSALTSIPWLPRPSLSVTNTGGFILSEQRGDDYTVVGIYDADGIFQHEMILPPTISSLRSTHIIQKSNGNLVLVSDQYCRLRVAEIDPNDGTVLRQYLLSDTHGYLNVMRTDVYGRILIISKQSNTLMLLDSEFNLLELTSPQLHQFIAVSPHIWHYNSERNEIVGFLDARKESVSFVDNGYEIVRIVNTTIGLPDKGVLTILGFTDA